MSAQPSRRSCPTPPAPVGKLAWPPDAHVCTPLTHIAPHTELHLRPQLARSHGGPKPISAHTSHRAYLTGSSTYCPSGHFCMAARTFRHTPHANRSPHGAAPTATMGMFTWRPRAHSGTPLAQIVPHRELHPRPQRVISHHCPDFSAPLTQIVPNGEIDIQPQRTRSPDGTSAAHPSPTSCPTGSSTYGPSGRVRTAAEAHFCTPPHADPATQGAPPTATVGAFACWPKSTSAHP